MLRYTTTDIVFQEIPDEVTLAVNLSGCPCRCPGCHSKQLWEEIGERLDERATEQMIGNAERHITCIAFMGGDASPDEVNQLAAFVRRRFPTIHTAWYSGRTLLNKAIDLYNFNYIKLGPYLAHLGALKSPRTNQKMYRVVDQKLHNITSQYWRKANL